MRVLNKVFFFISIIFSFSPLCGDFETDEGRKINPQDQPTIYVKTIIAYVMELGLEKPVSTDDLKEALEKEKLSILLRIREDIGPDKLMSRLSSDPYLLELANTLLDEFLSKDGQELINAIDVKDKEFLVGFYEQYGWEGMCISLSNFSGYLAEAKKLILDKFREDILCFKEIDNTIINEDLEGLKILHKEIGSKLELYLSSKKDLFEKARNLFADDKVKRDETLKQIRFLINKGTADAVRDILILGGKIGLDKVNEYLDFDPDLKSKFLLLFEGYKEKEERKVSEDKGFYAYDSWSDSSSSSDDLFEEKRDEEVVSTHFIDAKISDLVTLIISSDKVSDISLYPVICARIASYSGRKVRHLNHETLTNLFSAIKENLKLSADEKNEIIPLVIRNFFVFTLDIFDMVSEVLEQEEGIRILVDEAIKANADIQGVDHIIERIATHKSLSDDQKDRLIFSVYQRMNKIIKGSGDDEILWCSLFSAIANSSSSNSGLLRAIESALVTYGYSKHLDEAWGKFIAFQSADKIFLTQIRFLTFVIENPGNGTSCCLFLALNLSGPFLGIEAHGDIYEGAITNRIRLAVYILLKTSLDEDDRRFCHSVEEQLSSLESAVCDMENDLIKSMNLYERKGEIQAALQCLESMFNNRFDISSYQYKPPPLPPLDVFTGFCCIGDSIDTHQDLFQVLANDDYVLEIKNKKSEELDLLIELMRDLIRDISDLGKDHSDIGQSLSGFGELNKNIGSFFKALFEIQPDSVKNHNTVSVENIPVTICDDISGLLGPFIDYIEFSSFSFDGQIKYTSAETADGISLVEGIFSEMFSLLGDLKKYHAKYHKLLNDFSVSFGVCRSVKIDKCCDEQLAIINAIDIAGQMRACFDQ